MTTIMHWSPFTPKFHLRHHHVEDLFPHVEDLFPRFFDGAADEAAQPAASGLPAAEGRLEDGTYVIQFALPGELDDVGAVLEPSLRGGEPRRGRLSGLIRGTVEEPREQVLDVREQVLDVREQVLDVVMTE